MSQRSVIVSIAILTAIVSAAPISQARDRCQDSSRIVGGVPTTIKQHPWQVALIAPDGELMCGGSIIADKWILTAAHCFVSSAKANGMRAKAGITEYRQNAGSSEIEKIVVHQKYNRVTYENDLALIKLRNPPQGEIIPLADPALKLKQCDLLEVTGWGDTSGSGKFSTVLLKASIPYVLNATCNEKDSYNGDVRPGMMCAGFHEGGIDACTGDSGGPLVLRGADGAVLVGVVSQGEGCARKLKFGIYTRVSAYRDWITSVITATTN